MIISSRTPEGSPHRCPVCGSESTVEPSYPGGDSCCPACGQLLWWFRNRLSQRAGLSPEQVTLATSLEQFSRGDSLDTVELVMELEDAFDFNIPENEAERIQTVEDAIRYLRQHEGR